MDPSCSRPTPVNFISTVITADTRVTRKTDHPLGQSMAMEQKVQHVDGRDVALDLVGSIRTVVQQ